MTERKGLVYFAHPYGGNPDNLKMAKQRLREAQEEFPNNVIIAPWIPTCEVWDDADPEMRRRHLDDDLVVVRACEGIILAGEHLSPGMNEERLCALDNGITIIDRLGVYL